jgi:hypothetical protein
MFEVDAGALLDDRAEALREQHFWEVLWRDSGRGWESLGAAQAGAVDHVECMRGHNVIAELFRPGEEWVGQASMADAGNYALALGSRGVMAFEGSLGELRKLVTEMLDLLDAEASRAGVLRAVPTP